ncbi:hypothetical protein CRUP_033890, partial [Coryphaenoides rupestris]
AGTGETFTTSGVGGITAIKIWENANSYITGIQLRYGTRWGKMIGHASAIDGQKIELFDGETIIQVSGKFNPSNYIYQLRITTNRGRSLICGQPIQRSFNFYPKHVEAELRFLSGRFNTAGITSLGAHWGIYSTYDDAAEAETHYAIAA